ncbi:MAG TPA: hypothetical protein VHS80_13925 [Chthoniobacterales bacterium]|jgi:hypothetical protein|nr:hypothetical protein [Chthoniobacterales bacterium]
MNRRDFFNLSLGAIAFAAFRRKREILQRDQPVPGTLGTEDYHDWLKSHKALVNSSNAQWVVEEHGTYINLCQKNPNHLT